MHLSRWRAIVLLGALCSCGSADSTPPVRPQSVVVLSGDNQSAVRGSDLPNALRVQVLGSDSKPFAGATVTWAATHGQATISPTQTITDANGTAETMVSTLASLGSLTITATVGDLTPASFRVTALDPCSYTPIENVNAPIAGTLSAFDCDFFNGRFAKFYGFQISSPQALSVDLKSQAFDTALWFYTSGYPYALADMLDSTDASTNASFKVLVTPAEWVVGVSATKAGTTGVFTLNVSSTAESEDNCERYWITEGLTTNQELSATDCADGTSGSTKDVFLMAIHVGRSVTLTESSTVFTPLLRLVDSSGTVLAQASGTAGSATIQYSSTSSGVYVIEAASATPGGAGSYALTVSPSLAASISSSRSNDQIPQDRPISRNARGHSSALPNHMFGMPLPY